MNTLINFPADDPEDVLRAGSPLTLRGGAGLSRTEGREGGAVYKKGDEWKTTDLFNLTELLQLRAAIDMAVGEEGGKVGEGDK